MARKRKPDMALDQFQQVPEDQGVSLDELSESFARLLGEGEVPYDTPAAQDDDESGALAEPPDVDIVSVMPENIVEAILFVGHPEDDAISSRQIASLMRGVRAAEVEAHIADLNQQYEENNCPFVIESISKGYRMILRPEFHHVRERFYGRVRQAQLSQAAINALAIVAYNQPIEKKRIVAISNDEATGRVLTQLVRRGLLSASRSQVAADSGAVESNGGKGRKKRSAMVYKTTDRFLDLFGIESLDDLPRDHE